MLALLLSDVVDTSRIWLSESCSGAEVRGDGGTPGSAGSGTEEASPCDDIAYAFRASCTPNSQLVQKYLLQRREIEQYRCTSISPDFRLRWGRGLDNVDTIG